MLNLDLLLNVRQDVQSVEIEKLAICCWYVPVVQVEALAFQFRVADSLEFDALLRGIFTYLLLFKGTNHNFWVLGAGMFGVER
jgi:hypothetical protein